MDTGSGWLPRSGCVITLMLLSSALVLSGCRQGGGDQAADPVVVENAVAFIKRPLQFDEVNGELQGIDLREPATFRPGARLFLKDRAAAGAPARDISSAAFADPAFLDDQGRLRYDVRDLEVSYDGTKLLFAMRAPDIEGADDEDQPKWNIWEYDRVSASLRRIIESDVLAEDGHDVAPAYLADGRIVFSSTRQRASKAVLLDEGKPQFAALDEEREDPAFVLHVMESDGSDIQQITFNQSHDLDPTVLDDGRILFSRWDNAGQTPGNGINLYQVNPDGSGLAYLYGRHSHDAITGDDRQFLRAVETGDRQLLVQVQPFESLDLSVSPTAIDVAGFVEFDRTVDSSTGQAEMPLVSGPGPFGEPGLNGTYGWISPLFDGTDRYLVSWSPCRVVPVEGGGMNVSCNEERLASPAYEPAPPVYGLWVLDAAAGTQLPIQRPEEGQQFDEAVLMTSRPLPAFIGAPGLNGEAQALAEEGLGIVHIRSVYDFDGADTTPAGIAAMADPIQTPAANRPARFLRIEKPVSIPPDDVREIDNSAFGRSQAQSMREILGYVPVEPDGSVRLAVPADVAFAISVLDGQGQRITQRHQNWLQVRPGETVECIGCHTAASEVPHGRYGAGPAPVNQGAVTTGLEFPNSEPTLVADMGETMAETLSRINGIRRLTPDIAFIDEWTDPAIAPKADNLNLDYADLETPAPLSLACATEWTSACRIVINYETHIHPLWSLDRPIVDGNGVEIDNVSCTGCHTSVDAANAPQVPAGQLDLTDGPSPDEPDHFNAYRELVVNDNEQELVGGALADVMVPTGEFLLDDEGNQILDAEGNPIPILVPVNVPSSMNVAGARASARFMERFQVGGGHEGFLSPAELKLIAEWLDLGGQYYNNPFDAPEQ